MSSEKHLDIRVETIEGEAVIVTLNEENKVRKLMDEAFKALNIDPQGAPYEVRFENRELDPDRKIKDYGLKDDDVVLLQRVPKVG